MNTALTAAKIARKSLKRLSGVSVTYRRGESSLSVVATIGQTTRNQNRTDDVVTKFTTRDYLIDASELVLDDERFEPQDGDQIEESFPDGTTRIYEALPLGNEPSSRFSDRHCLTYRIHTELIEDVDS